MFFRADALLDIPLLDQVQHGRGGGVGGSHLEDLGGHRRHPCKKDGLHGQMDNFEGKQSFFASVDGRNGQA